MTKGAYLQQKSDLTGVYLKFITTYIQITSAVATFNLDVPEGIFKFQDTFSQPVT